MHITSIHHLQRRDPKILEHIRVEPEAPHIAPARGPPLWDDAGVQEMDREAGDGVEADPERDLANQAPPDYPDNNGGTAAGVWLSLRVAFAAHTGDGGEISWEIRSTAVSRCAFYAPTFGGILGFMRLEFLFFMTIVENPVQKTLGGTLEVKSSPGQGSSFVLRIPLQLALVENFVFDAVI